MANPVAFVLIENACLPNEKALIEALRRRHPGLLWESSAGPVNSGPDGYLMIRAGDHLVSVLLMPAPMPFNQQLWQQASSVWTEAFQVVERHRAHLVVSMMGSAVEAAETAKPTVIESSRLLTAMVGSLIEASTGCLAVAWNGQVGRSPEEWLDQSLRSFEPFPDHPYSLWIEIAHFVSGKTIGAYTIGLSEFIGREIEFEVDGLDQYGVTVRVANAASYLIANGLDENSKSGTVYEDDDEKAGHVAILHRNSRFGIGPVVSFFSLQDRIGRLKIYPIIPPSIARNHPLLVMLGKVGLFDPAKFENQMELRPDHYVSESRLQSFDDGISQALSNMLATDAYAVADTSASRALASRDIESARTFLLPWAEKVGLLQKAVKLSLLMCDSFMFMPAAPRSP